MGVKRITSGWMGGGAIAELGNPTGEDGLERTECCVWRMLRLMPGKTQEARSLPKAACWFSGTWWSGQGQGSGRLSRSAMETIPENPA